MKFTLPVITILAGSLSLSSAAELLLPDSATVLRATDYGIDLADNLHDDTKALQQAISEQLSSNPQAMLYLPAGVYNLRGPILPLNLQGKPSCHLVLVGQDREKTILKLRDKSPAFQDPAKPLALLSTGSEMDKNGLAFDNSIRNLTINTGNANPGAVGINFAVNQGNLLDLDIVSSDGQGAAGIRFPAASGPGLVKNVKIVGFDYGIDTESLTSEITFENIGLEKQNKFGIFNNGSGTLFMRNVRSNNTVPAYFSTKGGNLLLVGGNFIGGNPDVAAIVGSLDPTQPAPTQPLSEDTKNLHDAGTGSLYLRDIAVEGYGKVLELPGEDNDRTGTLLEELAYSGFTQSTDILTPGTSVGQSLRLTVPETPIYHTNQPDKWVVVAGDDGPAIQQAINQCPSDGIVYLPAGHYPATETIQVHGNVRKIQGLGAAKIHWREELKTENAGLPILQIDTMSHPNPVVLEQLHITGKVVQNGANPLAINSTRMESPLGFMDPSSDHTVTNSPTGTGPIFLEDIEAEITVNEGGTYYARQLHSGPTATGDPLIENHGTLWILGFDGTPSNPAVMIENFPDAKMELLGFSDKTPDPRGDTAAIVNRGTLTGAMLKFQVQEVYLDEQGNPKKTFHKNEIAGGNCPLYLAN